ncbi:hypothetical protein FOL47_010590, partial [Perkinsus chesapeaki]
TDATMHEHIATIENRGYAHRTPNGRFSPSELGVALVKGFGAFQNLHGRDGDFRLHLAAPRLRAQMEADMDLVARGMKTKESMVEACLSTMKEIFIMISDGPQPIDREIRDLERQQQAYLAANPGHRKGGGGQPAQRGQPRGGGGPPKGGGRRPFRGARRGGGGGGKGFYRRGKGGRAARRGR